MLHIINSFFFFLGGGGGGGGQGEECSVCLVWGFADRAGGRVVVWVHVVITWGIIIFFKVPLHMTARHGFTNQPGFNFPSHKSPPNSKAVSDPASQEQLVPTKSLCWWSHYLLSFVITINPLHSDHRLSHLQHCLNRPWRQMQFTLQTVTLTALKLKSAVLLPPLQPTHLLIKLLILIIWIWRTCAMVFWNTCIWLWT